MLKLSEVAIEVLSVQTLSMGVEGRLHLLLVRTAVPMAGKLRRSAAAESPAYLEPPEQILAR